MFPQVRLNTQNATRLVSRNVINLALLLFFPSTSPLFFLGALLVLVPVSLVNLGFPHCFLALFVASRLGDNVTGPFRSLHLSINQLLNPLISSASLNSAFRRPPAVESVAASSRIRATFHTFDDTWRHFIRKLVSPLVCIQLDKTRSWPCGELWQGSICDTTPYRRPATSGKVVYQFNTKGLVSDPHITNSRQVSIDNT